MNQDKYENHHDLANTAYYDYGEQPLSRLRRNSKKISIKHYFLRILVGFLMFIVITVVSNFGLFVYYARNAPLVSQPILQNAGSSTLYTSDGKVLFSLGDTQRTYLHNNNIPQLLKDAVISVEDKRFYHEPLGLDPLRIGTSMIANIKGHDISAGGSSITQQLIKLSVFSTAQSQRTIKRKIQEAWLAIKISRKYSKDKILEYYMNKVYMNYNMYGMGTAAHYYYGKPANKLDLAQTAMIAGIPNAPTSFNPYAHPRAATLRRNTVLAAMLKNGKITHKQYQKASIESVAQGLKAQHDNRNISKIKRIDDPYIKEVVTEVRAKGFDPYHDNLKIVVNINQEVQNKLYELVNNDEIPFTDNRMQVATTIVNPSNGHVIAILGGRHLPHIQLGLNRAVQTSRSTGSSIKPILDYAPAIEYKNWSTAQIVEDTPYIYDGTNIPLYDWDNRYMGPITMRYALEQSRNVPAVRTLKEIGLSKASNFVKPMGINIERKQGLSVAIGANASSLQMAGAYSTLANNGLYHKPSFISKIETPDGIIRNYEPMETRVMKPSTAYMVTDMLKGVISKGSGSTAQIKNLYQAGKTGTVKYSDDELVKHPSYRNTPKDSWFIGYNKSYVVSIWTGYDNLSDGKIFGIGENTAQLLYREMMIYLMKDRTNTDWTKPNTVVKQKVILNGSYDDQLYLKGYKPKLSKLFKRPKQVITTRRQSRTYYYKQPRRTIR